MLTSGMISSYVEDYETPQWLFDQLDNEFHFTLDPCASDENHKCDKYYTVHDNGLEKSWGGGDSILQSSLWKENQALGKESVHGKHDPGNDCCDADPG